MNSFEPNKHEESRKYLKIILAYNILIPPITALYFRCYMFKKTVKKIFFLILQLLGNT